MRVLFSSARTAEIIETPSVSEASTDDASSGNEGRAHLRAITLYGMMKV